MKSASVGLGTWNGTGRRPNGSGRNSGANFSAAASFRTRAMATTDFSARAMALTITRSMAAAASRAVSGAWAAAVPVAKTTSPIAVIERSQLTSMIEDQLIFLVCERHPSRPGVSASFYYSTTVGSKQVRYYFRGL